MKQYIIDTQILIWYQLKSQSLSVSNYRLLLDTANDIFVSQVSLFEIAIKQKIGKLPALNLSIERLVAIIIEDGFDILPIANAHINAYQDIPFLEHHKDPFDRLILATSLAENMPLISSDANFKYYTPQITLIHND